MSDERRQAQQSGENGAPGDQEGDGSPGQGDQQSDRAARAAEARLQNQIERAQQTLNRLQEGMNGNPGARRQLDRLQAFLNDARGTGTRLEGDAAKEYFNDRAYAPLSQIEDVIVQELDEIAMERKLHGARRSDVPAKYQELVDKYYESLSKENN